MLILLVTLSVADPGEAMSLLDWGPDCMSLLEEAPPAKEAEPHQLLCFETGDPECQLQAMPGGTDGHGAGRRPISLALLTRTDGNVPPSFATLSMTHTRGAELPGFARRLERPPIER